MAREFIVSALRMVAAAEGKVLAADNWGKAKTVVQIVGVVVVPAAGRRVRDDRAGNRDRHHWNSTHVRGRGAFVDLVHRIFREEQQRVLKDMF